MNVPICQSWQHASEDQSDGNPSDCEARLGGSAILHRTRLVEAANQGITQ